VLIFTAEMMYHRLYPILQMTGVLPRNKIMVWDHVQLPMVVKKGVDQGPENVCHSPVRMKIRRTLLFLKIIISL